MRCLLGRKVAEVLDTAPVGADGPPAAAGSTAERRLRPDGLEAEGVVAVPYPGVGKSGGLEADRFAGRVDEHHGVAEVSQAEQEAGGAV